jgi:AcrR family transcriptional regulator
MKKKPSRSTACPTRGSEKALDPARTDRGQQVKAVALSMFVKEGFGNVSLRHLGQRVGVHAGSLYHHVESKQALLFELIHGHLENMVEAIARRTRKAAPAGAKLSIFVRIHLEFQIHQQECAQLLGLELRSLDDAYRAQIQPLLARHRSCLTEIITAGVASEIFVAQPIPTSVNAVLGMLCSVAFWFREGHQPFEELVKQLTAMIFGLLCPPAQKADPCLSIGCRPHAAS